MIEDGILLVDKPANMTSFGVVARVRRQLTEKRRTLHETRGFCTENQHKEVVRSTAKRIDAYAERASGQTDAVMNSEPHSADSLAGGQVWRCKCRTKVGHTGTLDPFATGLMILVIGKECKNASNYSKLDKVYQATIRLGETSSTGDPEGEITQVSETEPTKAEIEKVLKIFIGEIEQTPPIYSAIKIDGQRAYKLARKGQKVDMPSRKITIYSIKILTYKYPNLVIEAHVSSGTYIRTLAEDIGKKLDTGAYCSELRRTKVGEYSLESSSLFSLPQNQKDK